jgi:hypothetical protein
MPLHLRGKDFRRVVTKVTVCDDWMLAGGKASASKRALVSTSGEVLQLVLVGS